MADKELLAALERIEGKLDKIVSATAETEVSTSMVNGNVGEVGLKIDDVYFLLRDQLLPILEGGEEG